MCAERLALYIVYNKHHLLTMSYLYDVSADHQADLVSETIDEVDQFRPVYWEPSQNQNLRPGTSGIHNSVNIICIIGSSQNR